MRTRDDWLSFCAGLSVLVMTGCSADPAPPQDPTIAGVSAPAPTAGTAAPAGGRSGPPPSAAGSGSGPAPAGRSVQPPTAGTGGGAPNPTAGTGAPIGPPPAFDAGSDPDRNKVVAGRLCDRLSTINCAGEAHCCSNPGRDVAACKAELMRQCSNELYLDDIAGNAITGFDATAAESAYTQLEQMASSCDPTVAAWGGSPTGLRSMLRGTVAPQGDCTPPDAIPTPPMAAAALASCSEGTSYACLFQSILSDWTCVPRNDVGGSCITDLNCLEGLYCNNPNMAPLGKCAARLADGTPCSTPTACTSLFCKGGACVPADQQAAYCLVN